MTKTEAGKIARQARRYGTATLVHRGGRTFKVEHCRAVDGLPRGWVVSERDAEPGITWTFVSGAWGTKREAMATIPSTEKKVAP